MKKIIITIPKEGKKWKVSFGAGSPILRKDLEPILVRIEKRLLASQFRDKTALVIKDEGIVINESCSSRNPKYLCWLLFAFLEDYISREYYLSKEKKYVGSEP